MLALFATLRPRPEGFDRANRDLCGADASGSFNREDFGLGAGKDWGFKMDVQLRIQVEAVAKE